MNWAEQFILDKSFSIDFDSFSNGERGITLGSVLVYV